MAEIRRWANRSDMGEQVAPRGVVIGIFALMDELGLHPTDFWSAEFGFGMSSLPPLSLKKFLTKLSNNVCVIDLAPRVAAELVTPVSPEHGLHQLVLKQLGGSLRRRACPDILTCIAREGERPWR